MPTRQHAVHVRPIASASSWVTSLRRLDFINSSRDLMICGFFEMVKTVEPCEENVCATVLSRPLMIVTTAITAVTPTMMPINVNAVRNLLARRLAVATRNASQIAARRNSDSDLRISMPFAALLDSLVFLDKAVANRDNAVSTCGNVVF